MKRLVACIVLGLLALVSLGQEPQGSFRVVFTNTEVGDILSAIAMRSKVSVVYSNPEKVKVTINVAARDSEEAIRCVASAAGLVYRKAGGTFVVAPRTTMRQALEPFGKMEHFDVDPNMASSSMASLERSFPYATFRLVGSKIVAIALDDDLAAIRAAVLEVGDRASLSKLVVETVAVRNAPAPMIAKLVGDLYPDLKVSAAGGENSNGGIVGLSGPENFVKAAMGTVSSLDTPRTGIGQEPIQYRVYELKYTTGQALKEFLDAAVSGVEVFVGPEAFSPPRPVFEPLGALLSGTSTLGGGAFGGGSSMSTNSLGGSSGFSSESSQKPKNERSKHIVLKGTATQIEEALKVVSVIDVQPIQLEVEVQVLESSPSLLEALGINHSWQPFDFYELRKGTKVNGQPGEVLKDFATGSAGFGQFTRAPWMFRAIVNAMVTKQELRILANPRVRVLDREDASIFIGDTIRTRIAQAGALGAQTIQIVEFPVGIILLIHPSINSDGAITMQVNPVISAVTSFDSENIPQTSIREARTTVVVRDGETMVLGGLIREEHIKTLREVPILSKLPIIGELFKDRSTSNKKTEVVVTITPKIIREARK